MNQIVSSLLELASLFYIFILLTAFLVDKIKKGRCEF